MKKLILFIFSILFASNFAFSQDKQPIKYTNPFEQAGIKGIKILTLSNGKYQEFHDLDSVVQIGTTLINVNSRKIVGFVKKDSVNSMPDASVSSRWISVDPLADKYYSHSPYNFVLNNPIIFKDPDGRDVKPTSQAALQMILLTLHPDDRKYVALNEKTGLIDRDLINQRTSDSKNFQSLQQLVNNETLVQLHLTDDKYSYRDAKTGEIHIDKNMGNAIENKLSADEKAAIGVTVDSYFELGVAGLVVVPERDDDKFKSVGDDEFSIDNSVNVYVNALFTDNFPFYSSDNNNYTGAEMKVKTTAHELYVHALRFLKNQNYIHNSEKNKNPQIEQEWKDREKEALDNSKQD